MLQLVFVTKHGKPIGITIPLDDDSLSIGIKKAVALQLYKDESISMGKMAQMMGISKQEAMKLLNDLKIEWLEYTKDELEKEAEKIQKWIKN